jgi:hypothetical protein
MILPSENSGREKLGKTTSSFINITSLKTFMTNFLEKTHKVKIVQSDVQTCYCLGVPPKPCNTL